MASLFGKSRRGPAKVAKAHVRRGDTVVVTKGSEKDKRGKVKRLVAKGRVEIEKVKMVQRHTKPTQKNPHGGIVEREGSIALASVALWCEKCAAGRRSRRVVDASGNKTRVCAKCQNPFPAPAM